MGKPLGSFQKMGQFDLRLSQEQWERKYWLITLKAIHGIDLSILNSVGYGETRLLNLDDPEADENRRVEVHLNN